jgi:hypothetical protein
MTEGEKQEEENRSLRTLELGAGERSGEEDSEESIGDTLPPRCAWRKAAAFGGLAVVFAAPFLILLSREALAGGSAGGVGMSLGLARDALQVALQGKEIARRTAEDVNVCPDDEEMFMSLCYKKCSLLTADKRPSPYPIRTSAWTCCLKQPCGFTNFVWKGFPWSCQGYGVSGDSTGNKCPHGPGVCRGLRVPLGHVLQEMCGPGGRILSQNHTYDVLQVR